MKETARSSREAVGDAGAEHARVADVFDLALAQPRRARRAFVDRACADEPDVRERVHAMLDQDEEGTKAYLLSPVPPVDAQRARELSAPRDEPFEAPSRIGTYRIVRPLGEGGMGIVYLAERETRVPARVALKVMRLGGDLRKAASRFEQERKVLALMEHENICRIVDGGTTDTGLPYFVMQYVPGARSLTRYARERELTIDQRLELFLAVCEAVQHGHDKGILHRDLKPSNVLVGRDGVPRLIDFGIARSLQADAQLATQMTEIGLLMGTLQYMSPEQLESEGRELDARSDVYSLGVILYELLTGRLPYDVKQRSLVDAARIIEEKPPVRPSLLEPALRGDLETILLKVLEKEPERRYPTVRELAADVARFRRAEPIRARPASLSYQLRLLTRRNRGLAIGLATTALALVLGIVASSVWAVRAEEERAVAERYSAVVEDAVLDADPTKTGLPPTLEWLLDRLAASKGELGDSPEAYAHLEATIGRGYANVGSYLDAERHLEVACRLLTEQKGADHPDTLEARVALGAVYLELCRDEKTEALLDELLPTLREVKGARHPLTLEALFQRGVHFYELDRLDEAQDDLERALAGRESALGNDDPDTLETRGLLALLYMDIEREEEAGEMLHAVLEAEERVLEAPRGDALGNLGLWYWRQGEVETAGIHLLRAHQTDLRALGPSHPWALLGAHRLGALYLELGELTEAEDLYAGHLELARESLGSTHPVTLSLEEGVARVRFDRGEVEEAQQHYATVVEGWREYRQRVLPLARALLRRGHSRLQTGDLGGAERDLIESLGLLERLGLGEGSETAWALVALAERYESVDRPDDARRVYARLEPR